MGGVSSYLSVIKNKSSGFYEIYEINSTNLIPQGYLDESVSAYNQALQISPEHSIALAGLARVRRKLGENDRAEKLFRRLVPASGDVDIALMLLRIDHCQ